MHRVDNRGPIWQGGVWARGGAPAPGPTLEVAPAVTGTPNVGQTLSASTGTWSGTGTISYARQWLRDGAPIAGATGATYTLVAADDQTAVSCRVTATDDLGSRVAGSNSVAVTYAAPVAAGALADQTLTVDEAITPIDVAADFTGGGMTFALAPSSAALPAGLALSSAGVITGTPTAITSLRTIVVRGTNSGGFDDTAFDVTITAAPVAPVLSGFNITAGSGGSGSMTLTVDVDCTIYGWIGPTGTTPTDAETRNGTGADGTFSQAVTVSGGPYTITLPAGLNGDYRVSVVGQVGAGPLSNVPTQSPVAFDTLAATLSSPTGTQTGQTTADWGVTSNEAGGTIYAGVRESGDAALTAAQLIAGAGGAGVAWNTDASPTADANNGGSFTGLTASTEYRVDMVQVDASGNQSSVVSSAAFSTASASYAPDIVDNQDAAYATIGAGGLTNSQRATLRLLIAATGSPGPGYFLASTRLIFQRSGTNGVTMSVRRLSTNTVMWTRTITGLSTDPASPTDLQVNFDFDATTPANSRVSVYVDGVLNGTDTDGINATEGYGSMWLALATAIGSQGGAGVEDMAVGDFYFETGATRAVSLFNDGSGPLDISAVGSPQVRVQGNAAVWNAGTNSGTGADLTVTNTFVDVV